MAAYDKTTLCGKWELLANEHGWSSSVPNLSGKLRRGSLRYTEAVELDDVLGYDLVFAEAPGGEVISKERLADC